MRQRSLRQAEQLIRFELDVASEESIKAGAKAVIEHFGKVEILVNNAGITRDMLAMRMKRKDWDDVLSTNLTGAFLLTQAVMSSMVKNRWGRIINVTSVVGETGAGQVRANYAASKAGLIGVTKSLARELAGRSITVNAVAPGYIETAMTAVLTEEQKNAMTQYIPLGRVGTDMDVAHAVAFLASEEELLHHRSYAGREWRHVHGVVPTPLLPGGKLFGCYELAGICPVKFVKQRTYGPIRPGKGVMDDMGENRF